MSSPSGTLIQFALIFYSFGSVIDLTAFGIGFLNLAVIWPTKILHINLKSILITQSVSVVLFASFRSIILAQKLVSNDPFAPANLMLQNVMLFDACFRRSIGHVLIIERFIATVRANSYEKFSKFYFTSTWFCITFGIAFVNTVTNGQSRTFTLFNVITASTSTILSFVEYMLIIAIGYHNRRKYISQIEKASSNNYHIEQRYQVSDNIKTAKQLSPAFLCLFLLNILTNLVQITIASQWLKEGYQISLVFAIYTLIDEFFGVAIELTVMTQMSSPSGTLLQFAYIFFSFEFLLNLTAFGISCLNLAVIWPTKILHINLKSILITQSVSVVFYASVRSLILVQKLGSNDPFAPANLTLQNLLIFDAFFRRLLGHALIIDRLLAFFCANSYERFSKFYYCVTWFGITFTISLANTITNDQSWTITISNLISQALSTILSFIEYLFIIALGYYNRKRYNSQIEEASPNNYRIGKRHQVSGNIKTAKQLSPAFLCLFLLNIFTNLVQIIIASQWLKEGYQISLAYAVCVWVDDFFCVTIEFTVMTHHPMLKQRLATLLKKFCFCCSYFKLNQMAFCHQTLWQLLIMATKIRRRKCWIISKCLNNYGINNNLFLKPLLNMFYTNFIFFVIKASVINKMAVCFLINLPVHILLYALSNFK